MLETTPSPCHVTLPKLHPELKPLHLSFNSTAGLKSTIKGQMREKWGSDQVCHIIISFMVLCVGLVKTENVIYLVNVLGCVCFFNGVCL